MMRRGPRLEAPELPAPRDIDVMPLGASDFPHTPGRSCACSPILSAEDKRGRVVVHRLAPALVSWRDREEEEGPWEPS